MEAPNSAVSSSPAERSAVISKAVVRAADKLGMTDISRARTIGLPEADVSRLRAGSYLIEPDTKPYELALLLIRLFHDLAAIVGGEEASIRSWMEAQNHALGGTPLELVQTVTGLMATAGYLGMLAPMPAREGECHRVPES